MSDIHVYSFLTTLWVALWAGIGYLDSEVSVLFSVAIGVGLLAAMFVLIHVVFWLDRL